MFQTETQTLLVYSWLKIPNHLGKGQSEHFLCFISLQQTVSHQLRGTSSFQHYPFPLFQKLWRSVVGLVCKPNRLPYLCSQVGHLRWLPNCKFSFGNNSLELNSPPLASPDQPDSLWTVGYSASSLVIPMFLLVLFLSSNVSSHQHSHSCREFLNWAPPASCLTASALQGLYSGLEDWQVLLSLLFLACPHGLLTTFFGNPIQTTAPPLFLWKFLSHS